MCNLIWMFVRLGEKIINGVFWKRDQNFHIMCVSRQDDCEKMFLSVNLFDTQRHKYNRTSCLYWHALQKYRDVWLILFCDDSKLLITNCLFIVKGIYYKGRSLMVPHSCTRAKDSGKNVFFFFFTSTQYVRFCSFFVSWYSHLAYSQKRPDYDSLRSCLRQISTYKSYRWTAMWHKAGDCFYKNCCSRFSNHTQYYYYG